MSHREELTRQAEKCLRQGRVDDAIALYQELADLTPIDWGIVRQLADLFERAGQREAASRQFCRWADHLAVEGFHSKAAALYKKVLKLEPSDEHALWQLGEVSLELELRADARVAFQRVLDLRQRRGDTTGVVGARERLTTLEAAAPTPVRSPRAAVPPTAAPSVAVSHPPIVAASLPTPPPSVAAAPVVPPPATIAAPPAPPMEVPSPPAETPERRLARLRHEADEADRLQREDAEARWRAVLDADPQDVATRLRLVQRAMDRRDFEDAERLALPLDASETSALVLLVELAWRRGHLDAVRRLVAGRVHAGASPGHILAPVDALGSELPDAARTALAAAVAAWNAAGQPGHAVAALELADGRGLLDVEAYLQWVEICVDAGVSGLSRAQASLTRAYVAAGRVADARAVAEDLFVRELGAEPYRALLLDVLDRLGESNPHRVLVDLLTPPSEVGDEPTTFPSSVVHEVIDLELDSPLTAPAGALMDLPGWLEPSSSADAVPEPGHTTWPEATAGEVLPGSTGGVAPAHPVAHGAPSLDLPDLAVEPAATAKEASMFDWALLLGRDVDERWSSEPAVAASIEIDGASDIAAQLPASDADADPIAPIAPEASVTDVDEVAAAAPEAPSMPAPASQPEPAVQDVPLPAPVGTTEEPVPLGVPEHDPYDVRTPVDPMLASIAAAQPLMAGPAEVMPPTFAVPSSWFSTTTAEQDAAPRRRHPDDSYLFEDEEQMPSRWPSRSTLVPPQPVSTPASPPHAATPAPGDGASDPAAAERTGPGPGDVEEEIDLTQLLEELRPFDTVLPDPPARPAAVEPPDAAPAEPASPVSVDAVPAPPSLADLILPPPPPEDRWPMERPTPFTQETSTELDAVFADLHRHDDARLVAEQQLAAGRVFLAAGLVAEAARAFERASDAPRSRFAASQALAELHRSRGQLLNAVSWYEQAAAAPVQDAVVKRPVLYDLAESLEALGETDRALGVLLDLLSQVEDYRDARARLDRLLRVDAGG